MADGSRLRICFISDAYPPAVGGLARSARRLTRSLSSAGQEVHVFALDGRIPPGERIRFKEGELVIHRLGPYKKATDTLTDLFEFVASVHREVGFDVFHGHFAAHAGFVASALGRYVGRPSVVAVRGNDLDRLVFDPKKAFFVVRALAWADVVTVVSTDLARKVRAFVGRDDAILIPNGVDAQLFRPLSRDETLAQGLGLPQGRAVIGFVGEARAKKGLAVLLKAFARLASEHPVALFMVGGVRKADKPTVEYFRRRHPDLPLVLLPYRPQEELPSLYALMDVVALPSLRDGLPNALLEAMACERAVVASAVGGIADVIADGEDGLLVPPRDEDALFGALRRLLDDSDLRSRLGRAARRKVLESYTPEKELNAYLALYRDLAGRFSSASESSKLS